MDQSKHSVTLPAKDYMELLEYKSKNKDLESIILSFLSLKEENNIEKNISFDDIRKKIKQSRYTFTSNGSKLEITKE